MRSIICPIVGAFFRPPAKQLLAAAPLGCELLLVPEPDNPYDSNAMQVHLDPLRAGFSEAVLSQLADELPLSGSTIEQVMSGGPVQLGYVAATGGKPLAKINSERVKAGEEQLQGNAEVIQLIADAQEEGQIWVAVLELAADGKPLIRVSADPGR